MTGPLLIIGGGGHGRVVADVAGACGYDPIAFLDDAYPALTTIGCHRVLGPATMIHELLPDWPSAVVAIGDNAARLHLFECVRQAGFSTPAIVHPSAVVSRGAMLDDGTFVAPGAVINVGARIGEASIVNTGARIDHDCMIGSANHIAPGATLSGNVTTGERVWLGTGCSVRQGVKIGSDALVGVGAAVVDDLAGNATYTGVPARPR